MGSGGGRALNRDAVQRRTLRVLVGAQVLGGLGQSGAAAGALLALEVTGSEPLSSLPLGMLVVGSALAVVPVTALSDRVGRRAGLTTALVVAAAGAAGVVGAGAVEASRGNRDLVERTRSPHVEFERDLPACRVTHRVRVFNWL